MRHTRIGSQVMRWTLPALLIAYATLHRLGQTYGSTFYERHAPNARRWHRAQTTVCDHSRHHY